MVDHPPLVPGGDHAAVAGPHLQHSTVQYSTVQYSDVNSTGPHPAGVAAPPQLRPVRLQHGQPPLHKGPPHRLALDAWVYIRNSSIKSSEVVAKRRKATLKHSESPVVVISTEYRIMPWPPARGTCPRRTRRWSRNGSSTVQYSTVQYSAVQYLE